jgi:hypothetical protein
LRAENRESTHTHLSVLFHTLLAHPTLLTHTLLLLHLLLLNWCTLLHFLQLKERNQIEEDVNKGNNKQQSSFALLTLHRQEDGGGQNPHLVQSTIAHHRSGPTSTSLLATNTK